jgi:hypothetical protein
MSGAAAKLQRRLLLYRAIVLWSAGSLALVGFLVMLAWHWDYYSAARAQRPFLESHGLLRSSGKVGLPTGIWASALFVLNLGYLIRKRLIKVKVLGPLRMWMDTHVLTGLIGGGLVVFHSAVAPSSVLGTLALLAMTVTVLTGIVGRTIYVRVPRSIEGRELELEQVQEKLDSCRQLLEISGVQAEWMDRSRPQARIHRTGLAGCFVALIIGDIQRRRDYRCLKEQILASPELRPAARKVLPRVKDYCMHWQWLIRYHELRSLISSWRFFHRWVAILMLCVVICHIVVAIRFADLSIWGGGQ